MEPNLSPAEGTGRFWIIDSIIGVTVPQEVQVDVLKRVSRRVFEVAEDWRRVWKSAGRRIDGWTRFET